MKMKSWSLQLEGTELLVTHPDKILWPASAYHPSRSKSDYIRYLTEVAPWVLPHLAGRPLVLTRYPHGAEQEGFYQKNLPDTAPSWLKRFRFQHKERDIEYLIVDGLPALLWVGQQNTLEWHPWQSRLERPLYPDRAVIDLDPSEGVGFERVRQVASLVHDLLHELGLKGYPKTSGATGLHIMIPVRPTLRYRQVVEVMRALAELLVTAAPHWVTTERKIVDRKGLVYVDFLQNSMNHTLVGVFSPRPRPGAPCSCPFAWDELSSVQPEKLSFEEVIDRLNSEGDPSDEMLRVSYDLEPIAQRLGINLRGVNGL